MIKSSEVASLLEALEENKIPMFHYDMQINDFYNKFKDNIWFIVNDYAVENSQSTLSFLDSMTKGENFSVQDDSIFKLKMIYLAITRLQKIRLDEKYGE